MEKTELNTKIYDKIIEPVFKKVHIKKIGSYGDIGDWSPSRDLNFFKGIDNPSINFLDILNNKEVNKKVKYFSGQFAKNFSPQFSFCGDNQGRIFSSMSHDTNLGQLNIDYVVNNFFSWNTHGLDYVFYREVARPEDIVRLSIPSKEFLCNFGASRSIEESLKLYSGHQNTLEEKGLSGNLSIDDLKNISSSLFLNGVCAVYENWRNSGDEETAFTGRTYFPGRGHKMEVRTGLEILF